MECCDCCDDTNNVIAWYHRNVGTVRLCRTCRDMMDVDSWGLDDWRELYNDLLYDTPGFFGTDDNSCI